MTGTRQDIRTALADAVAAEAAAADALEALEDAAKSGMDVSTADMAEAAGTVVLRRLRRGKLEAEADAAAVAATAEDRQRALDELARRAAADDRLNPDVIRNLETAARAAVQAYAHALTEADRAFGDLVTAARNLDLPLVGKHDPGDSVMVAGSSHQTGRTVRLGDPVRVKLAGVGYAGPPPNAFSRFAAWVSGLLD